MQYFSHRQNSWVEELCSHHSELLSIDQLITSFVDNYFLLPSYFDSFSSPMYLIHVVIGRSQFHREFFYNSLVSRVIKNVSLVGESWLREGLWWEQSSDVETEAQRSEEVESTYLVPRVSPGRHKKAVVWGHYLKLKFWHFIFIRSWLSSSTLKSIRYKIVNFDTKLLEGKVKEEPDQGESIKPVSSIHLCI